MTDQQNNDAALPDEFIRALRNADKAPPMITARVDQVLDDLAAGQFADRVPRRRGNRFWYAAAASILGVAVILQMQPLQQSSAPVANQHSLLYTDVDGSGQIDIADVMALALLDDDRYSQDDLNAFAMRVVSLGEES